MILKLMKASFKISSGRNAMWMRGMGGGGGGGEMRPLCV